jgi:hypothetical protein
LAQTRHQAFGPSLLCDISHWVLIIVRLGLKSKYFSDGLAWAKVEEKIDVDMNVFWDIQIHLLMLLIPKQSLNLRWLGS